MKNQQYYMVISFDGLAASDWDTLQALPNFRRFLAGAGILPECVQRVSLCHLSGPCIHHDGPLSRPSQGYQQYEVSAQTDDEA